MSADGSVLASNVSGVQTTKATNWKGGRTSLVLNALAYDATCFLQAQGPSGAWINVNPVAFTQDQVTAFDLPEGQYRLNLGSATSSLYASLVSIPYL